MKYKGKKFKTYEKFILMALNAEGPLSSDELDDKFLIFISSIWYHRKDKGTESLLEYIVDEGENVEFSVKHKIENDKIPDINRIPEGELGSSILIERLIDEEYVEKINNKYQLTSESKQISDKFIQSMQKRGKTIDQDFFNTSATARNNIFMDAFLAILKLSAGFISGSVGLMSDGLDNITDTISAFLVWVGMKLHHEFLSTVLVIFMLFVAGFSAIYGAVNRILSILSNTLTPISQVSLIIIVEIIAICTSFSLFIYQRHVGHENNNLTIISQSVDSRNQIFVGLAVIVGAVFSILNFYWVDAVVGLFIGTMIFKSAIGLAKDVESAHKGENTDFNKYKTFFGNYMKINHMETYQFWILYGISNRKIYSKKDLVNSFENAFNNRYIPMLSELNVVPVIHEDFDKCFSEIINPLISKNWVIEKGDDVYNITDSGLKYLTDILDSFNDFNFDFLDSFLLKISDES
jgi:Co/Zn/Cd efflux system component